MIAKDLIPEMGTKPFAIMDLLQGVRQMGQLGYARFPDAWR
jgi:hypothetical protein